MPKMEKSLILTLSDCQSLIYWYHDKIKHNTGMERGTTIILVSTDSALIRQYKFTSLKKCKLNFTYRGKFP